MSLFHLDNAAARRVFLSRHGLSAAPQGPGKGADLLDVITQLGFVQLDSINTVARAHDLILFSRRPAYRPKHLKRLYENDGTLFEHWTHDAAVIPMSFYPWWHLRRIRDAEILRKRWKAWRREGFEGLCRPVLDQIRETGPVTSSDVGEGEARGSGGWWDWHPSKTALEYLWRSGALCVVGRDGFRKRYDLTERVLEETLCDTANAPSTEETIDWCCRNALRRLGFATHGELAAFWDHITPAEAKIWCEHALQRGDIIEIRIQSAEGDWRSSYAEPSLPDDPCCAEEPTSRLRLLSPFDPAIRDRKRAQRLFGFDYRIEIFVPEAKRKYGYYVFPILQGARLVARADIKADRATDQLAVRAVWPEPGVRWTKGRAHAFDAELQRVCRLADVRNVTFAPDWLRDPLF